MEQTRDLLVRVNQAMRPLRRLFLFVSAMLVMSDWVCAVRSWARRWGLAGFGFAQDDYRDHHQLLVVWRPFRRPRVEVWRWPAGFTSRILEAWMKPVPFGSSEAYHRIGLSAERVYSGPSHGAAMDAMRGVYPPEILALDRPRLPGDPL